MIVLADPDRRFQARVSDAIGRKDDFQIVDSVLLLDKVLHDKSGQVAVVVLGPNLGMEESLEVSRRIQTTMSDISVVLVATLSFCLTRLVVGAHAHVVRDGTLNPTGESLAKFSCGNANNAH